MMRDGSPHGFHDRKCATCGKIFLPAPYHQYYDDYRVFCSYSCYMKHYKRKKTKGRTRKPVHQYTMDGVYIASYADSVEAADAVGVMHTQCIRNACEGYTNSSGGFRWSYEKKKGFIRSRGK